MTGNDTNAVLSFNIGPGDDCETTQTGVFGISVPDMGELYVVEAFSEPASRTMARIEIVPK